MRARYKGPSGTGVVELPDDATVEQLFSEIQTRTGIANFTLKYGWPLKTLDMAEKGAVAKSLGLSGESFTIVPDATDDAPPSAPSGPSQPGPSAPSSSVPSAPSGGGGHHRNKAAKRAAESPEDVTVPWPEREGTLVVRVMPSDNSCLFTAVGGALDSGKQIPAPKLRKMVADYIETHPEDYNAAILGMPPQKYCRDIQGKDHWGGAIELGIFSNMFDIEIRAFDVKEQQGYQFGENKARRCILIYSGIHYDRVAFSFSEAPFKVATFPPEFDTTIWDADDDSVLDKTRELVAALNRIHYYTDPTEILLRCDVPGCDWIGSGQREGSKHAEMTGHMQLSEVEDTSLLKCNAPGCDWLGSGETEATKHRNDTGHTKWSVIPDF